MIEPEPDAKNVFYVDLDSDLSKVASDLGLGLLPDEMEKVKKYLKKRTESLRMLSFKQSIRRGLNIAVISPQNLF